MGRGSRRSKDDPSVAGVLCVDKPSGLTSHDVVDRVRRRLGVRRVGHAGTLDPMATGVLIIGVGPTTRLMGIITGHDKEYTATIRLGASTTTDDREGDVIAEATIRDIQHVTDASIADSVAHFTGALEQRPSAVSAVKVDGKRAYQRVRDGEEVELPARAVTVEEFTILDIRRGEAATELLPTVLVTQRSMSMCAFDARLEPTSAHSPAMSAKNFVWAVTSPHCDERGRGQSTLPSASTSTALISST